MSAKNYRFYEKKLILGKLNKDVLVPKKLGNAKTTVKKLRMSHKIWEDLAFRLHHRV